MSVPDDQLYGRFQMFTGMMPLIIIAVALIFSSIKVLNEYERGVVLTLGRFTGVRGPGLVFILPGIQQMFRLSTRVVVLDVPPQDVITRDNISVKVNAVIYFRVINPQTAVLNVENYMYATSQLAQTTLRSVLGQQELDDLLANRDKINKNLQEILDLHTEPWGIKISSVEVKNVDLPQEMQRAIARQAEAERERRAKVIHAEGEFQAAQKLADAAQIMAASPASIQLRYLQTLTEIATDNNSTTIFPVPIDLIQMFLKKSQN
ncbi:MAG TPA: slipin family protein [Elusimicrobiales bacterium]|nr:slipin family protein [Elusimicrobiales bacterium]